MEKYLKNTSENRQKLIEEVIKPLFADSVDLMQYGPKVEADLDPFNHAEDLKEVDHFSSFLSKIMQTIKKANPKKVYRKFNGVQIWFGTHLQRQINFVTALRDIEHCYLQAKEKQPKIKDHFFSINSLYKKSQEIIDVYSLYIDAGKEYAEKEVNNVDAYDMGRFLNAINNLAVLRQNAELESIKLKQFRDVVSGVLDRYAEIEKMTLPLWISRAKSLSNMNDSSQNAILAIVCEDYQKMINNFKYSIN